MLIQLPPDCLLEAVFRRRKGMTTVAYITIFFVMFVCYIVECPHQLSYL